MNRRLIALLTACLPAALPAALPANAEEADGLVFGGEGDTRFQVEATRAQGAPTRTTLFNETNLSGYAHWSDWLSIDAALKLEHQRFNNLTSYYPDRNSAFRSHGLSLRQLYVTVTPVEEIDVFAGKIHPRFGTAWRVAPGIFYNFGTDYEQDDRVGAGVVAKLPEALGGAKLSVEAHFIDTSFLSTSLFARPSANDPGTDRPRRFHGSDGGAANTGRPQSVTVALAHQAAEGVEELTYQIAYTHEAVDQATERAEDGVTISASHEIGLTPKISLTPFAELTYLRNAGGVADVTRHYAIAGASLAYEKWELALAGGLRVTRLDGDRRWDSQVNLSVSYEILDSLKLGVGVNRVRIDGRAANTGAVSTSYAFKF